MKNVLLLQGPVGPFFKLLARYLKAHANVNVFQITFNGGDEFFCDKEVSTRYQGTPEHWSGFLTDYIAVNEINEIVVFGDCRFYHRVAKKIADGTGVNFWAFEEGYLRPTFITLEKDGVNGNSNFCPLELNEFAPDDKQIQKDITLSSTYLAMSCHALQYYFFKMLYKNKYKKYIHHRPWLNAEEAFSWIRSGIRKIKYKHSESKLQDYLTNDIAGQYFLAPLQVSVDSQILYHSPYRSVEEFIGVVIRSFAQNADKKDFLVFKHHPMDRGFNNYARYIKKLSYAYDVCGRVLYCHDLDLPSLLKKTKGTITINSTVGISSLHHTTPTKVLGKAIYNIDGVTSQKSLDEFWLAPCVPCPQKFHTFRTFLRDKNQIPGSFYRKPELTLQAVADKIFI